MSTVPLGVSTLIDSLDIPSRVKVEAKNVYLRLDRDTPPRSNNRKGIVCYCVYQAYLIVSDSSDIPASRTISRMVGLDHAIAQVAMGTKMKYREGYHPVSATIDHVKIMQGHVKNVLCLDDDVIQAMSRVLSRVLDVNTSLLSKQANIVVGAFILCYLDTNGFEVNTVALLGVLSLKDSSVSPIRRQIGVMMADI